MTRNQNADLILNSDFYDETAVRTALDDFKGMLTGSVSKNGKSIIIKFSKVEGDREKVKNEFCNYILALMKNIGLV